MKSRRDLIEEYAEEIANKGFIEVQRSLGSMLDEYDDMLAVL